eukprot:m.40938 g.40938  ORF g.40938 m.40938 type:complete len:391 (+) comp11765_c1_seq1:708-1880(+)
MNNTSTISFNPSTHQQQQVEAKMNAEGVTSTPLSVLLQDDTHCGNPACREGKPRHKCARCMSICYCSKECQLAHYAVHKTVCKTIAAKFCMVREPTFIGFNPMDPEDLSLVAKLDAEKHKENAQKELFYPILAPHVDDFKAALSPSGEYIGMRMSSEILRETLNRADLRAGKALYNVPLFCGVARLSQKVDIRFIPYVPKISTIVPSTTKVGLNDLIAWRRSSMKKQDKGEASPKTPTTPMDNANLILELLCLLDKTVFPTLQLFRALNQKGALVVHADKHELSWQYVNVLDLKDFGREVKQCVDSYDINASVVTLTSGSCIDPLNKATVLMLTPLHVSQAFHEQQVDQTIMSAVGATRHHLPQSSILYKLIKRNKERINPGEVIDESEA